MKQVQDALNSYSDFMKGFDAWRASQRPVGTEHYINGQAYLEWNVELSAFGQRYALCLRTKVVDPLLDPLLGLPLAFNVPSIEYPGGRNREEELVLIDKIEFVQRRQQIIPSWVGLYVTTDLLGGGWGFPRFPLQSLLEIGLEFCKGESGITDRLAFSGDRGANRMIQCGSKIVNSVTGDSRDHNGDRPSERHHDLKSLDLEIRLLDNAVWASAQKRGDFSTEFKDVRLRPLDL